MIPDFVRPHPSACESGRFLTAGAGTAQLAKAFSRYRDSSQTGRLGDNFVTRAELPVFAVESCPMSDRVLSRSLWLVVMCLITASAMGSLVMLYSGLFKLITHQFESGGTVIGVGILFGVGCWVLCKHCDDLVDRRRA